MTYLLPLMRNREILEKLTSTGHVVKHGSLEVSCDEMLAWKVGLEAAPLVLDSSTNAGARSCPNSHRRTEAKAARDALALGLYILSIDSAEYVSMLINPST